MFCGPNNRGNVTRILLSILLVSPISGPMVQAQGKHRVSLDDLWTVKEIRSAELSPNGDKIAFMVSGTLEIGSVHDPEHSKPLGSAMVPTWSPSGQKLAYYSDQTGTQQLWVYDSATQQSKVITKIVGGITAEWAAGSGWGDDNWRYSWSPDGTQIVFASQLPSPTFISRAETDESKKPGQPLVLNGTTPANWTLSGIFVSAFDEPTASLGPQANVKPPLTSQLFTVDVSTGITQQITHDGRGYFTPDWSPDGKMIVCSTPSGRDMYGFPVNATSILLLNIKTGGTRSLTSAVGNKSMPTWSPDGHKIAFFTGEHDGLKSVDVFDMGNGEVQDLSRHLPVGIGTFRWSPNSKSILGIAMNGVDWRPVRIGIEHGDVHALEKAEAARRWQLSVAQDGSVAWPESDGTHNGVIRLLRSGALHSEPIFDSNPQIRDWQLGAQDVVRWKGGRGEEMEGILIKPAGYQPGKRYPLIVVGYPGFTNRFMDIQILGNQAWASLGYAIFYPDPSAPHVWMDNFRTRSFDEMAKGPDGWEITTEQVLSGVNELIKRGIVDPNRMGLLGFSNGGGVVNALVTRTNRFRCAVSVAAVYPDLLAPFFLHSDSHIPDFFANGDPLKVPENYLELSSVYRADRVETPMLIADGDLDQDFLIGSIEWFNALRWSKKNVTFLRYPGQGHGFDQPAMEDFWIREKDFFARYLQPVR
jgi:dipeptidyl aminopeptidase/acylaminoacyl peptidase